MPFCTSTTTSGRPSRRARDSSSAQTYTVNRPPRRTNEMPSRSSRADDPG